MVFKKSAILFIAAILSLNLMANDQEVQNDEPIEKCEKQYSTCLNICDSKDESQAEACYDKCDESYSKCLEAVQSN